MRRRALAGWVVVLAMAAAFVALPLSGGAEEPAPVPAQTNGIAEQLHYIGRDYLTGMPATVSDRFIAQVERSVALYGIEESKPEPPPPLSADDRTVTNLAVPAIGVTSAGVARFGLDRFGRLDVPQDNQTVGWNPAFTSIPGRGRSTFFAAHFEYRGVPGVFFRLSSLRSGAEVMVTLSDGSRRRYRVTSTVDYALGAIDMSALLQGREGVESLVLMTCSGPANEGNYPLRTVVLAEAIAD